MPLFHTAPILLGEGSIVLPGNWARIIQSYGEKHQRWQSETALEQIRAQHFKDKPSRRDCTFFCRTEQSVRLFMTKQIENESLYPVLYEVEKVDPHAIEHNGNWNVTFPVPRRPESMEQIAFHYWRDSLKVQVADGPTTVITEETITLSPLRIIRRVD